MENHFLIDRIAMPGYGPIRGTRQISDTKVLAWFGIYESDDEEVGANVHLLDLKITLRK